MEMYSSKIMKNLNFYMIIAFIGTLSSQLPLKYSLDNFYEDRFYLNRMQETSECSWPGLSIIDLKFLSNEKILAGTGGGLGYFSPPNEFNSGDIYFSIVDDNLPLGGTPALKVYDFNDSKMIVVSGVQTIDYNGESAATGTGISWSFNDGEWTHVEQPQDATSGYAFFDWYGQSVQFQSISSAAKNVSYDLAVDTQQGYIYAASWAGALRRYNFLEEDSEWEIVPLPMDFTPIILDGQEYLSCDENFPTNYIYNPVDNATGNDNHKAFSVHVEDNIIWCGTADGINKGVIRADGCIDWQHYSTENGGLAGDWIIGFEIQYTNDNDYRLWANSWDASVGTPIPHGLSFTDDYGNTWNQVSFFKSEDNGGVSGSIVYNIYFYEDFIYVSADNGLFKCNINSDITLNENWYEIEVPLSIKSELQYEKVYSTIVYEDFEKMWIGTDQGFITSDNLDFNSWDVPRLDLLNCDNEKNQLIAYPNPYYTDNNQNIKFKFQSNQLDGIIDVFDFSMNRVANSINANYNNGYLIADWDAKNLNNRYVPNGTYFCRLKTSQGEYWNKIIIVNIK